MRNAYFQRLLQTTLLLLSLSISASPLDSQRITTTDLQDGFSLAGDWQYHAGDDLRWAAPDFDDSAWGVSNVPQRWPKGEMHESRQFSWYRLTLHFDGHSGRQPPSGIGVQIGKVLSAYELYAGGELLGGIGKLPPLSRVNYDQKRVFHIPASAISADGVLVLALRVWGGSELSVAKWGEGPHEGEFRIGYYDKLLYDSFLHELPGLMMSILIAGFGLYHIYLYWRNRQLHVYLWYGLVALDISLFSFLSGQLRYSLGWSFTLYEKIEFGTIYLLPALFIQMLWTLLGLRIGPALRAYQLCSVAFSLAALLMPGLAILYISLFPWEIYCIPLLVLAPWMIVRGARAGNPEARTTMVGLVIFVLACGSDLMIDFAGWGTPRLLPLGFVAIMLSMAISLANRFTAMLDNLEGEVAQRTTELSAANEQLAAVARQDPLTGLLNRRGFIEVVAAEMQRFMRTGRTFSLVLADLDNFKQFNDRHGHVCGDFVLQEVARLLDERVRDMDSVARWGGEEFMVIIPETGPEGAALLAESLRLSVQNSQFQYGEERLGVTMTLGIATFGKGDTLDSCIARADEALYGGKQQGRNQVGLNA
jgi:diguanylate cyclase (GGDEF)-like protein